MLVNINWLSHIVYSYVIYIFLWMLTYDSKTFMLCAHFCFFFFSHASTMDLLFPILSLLSFSGFNLASLLTTAYMTIYILFLRYFSYFTVWKIRFTFQSPISGGGGTLSLHHCLSRPLTCKHILQSFSTLGLYPPTEKPIYNQR